MNSGRRYGHPDGHLVIGKLGRRTVVALLVHSTLTHAATFLIRPAVTYRALELDVPGFALGLLAASYAIFPLLLAVPSGILVDRLGERALLWTGSGLVLTSSISLLFFGGSVPTLTGGMALLGAGQLACVVGQQSVIANNSRSSELDAGFGYLTFASSLGQAFGPLTIALIGGTSVAPDTRTIFLLSVGMGLALVGTTLGISSKPGREQANKIISGGRRGSVGSILRTPGVPGALVASATVLAVVDLTTVYLPALGAERGLTSATVGLMLTVRALFSMVSRIGLGKLSRRLGRMPLLAWSLVLSTVALALVAIPMPASTLFIILALLGLGLGIGQPLTMSWLSSRVADGQRGRALAVRLAGNKIGQVVLPSAVGMMAAGLGTAGVFLVSAVVVGGSLLLLRGVRPDD